MKKKEIDRIKFKIEFLKKAIRKLGSQSEETQHKLKDMLDIAMRDADCDDICKADIEELMNMIIFMTSSCTQTIQKDYKAQVIGLEIKLRK